MLSVIFVLCVCGSVCGAQLYGLYGGPATFRRAPVRRSPMEALERLRAPRYFPQVEYADEGAAYALPPQWSDAAAMYNDEPEDEEEYEYEIQPPIYRSPLDAYPQQQNAIFQQFPEAPLASYDDLMRGYAMAPPPQETPVYLQRRSELPSLRMTPPPPTSAPEQPPMQTAPTSAPVPLRVQSLVLPDPSNEKSSGGIGQKEEPLFRPLHSSQRTAEWPQQKSPIPMLKQMIQGAVQKKQQTDPLLEELSNLKKV